MVTRRDGGGRRCGRGVAERVLQELELVEVERLLSGLGWLRAVIGEELRGDCSGGGMGSRGSCG